MPTKPAESASLVKKLVFFGAARVGKSAIIRRFVDQIFSEQYTPTVEDMFETVIDHEGVYIRLRILDTGGSFSFPAMRQLALNQGDLFVVVYSPNDLQSYLKALTTCAEITEEKGHDQPIVVVANKTDLDDRMISQAEAELMFCQWNTYHIESSAKEENYVNYIFKKCLELMRPVDYTSVKDSSPDCLRKRGMAWTLSSHLLRSLSGRRSMRHR